jgi:hypothetical protein
VFVRVGVGARANVCVRVRVRVFAFGACVFARPKCGSRCTLGGTPHH